MPLYAFKCECGNYMEEICSISERSQEKKCDRCGKMAPRDYTDSGHCHSEKEMVSRAMGIHPRDIPKAMKKWPGSRYDPRTGHLLLRGRTERNQRMRERGFVDYEGYN